MVEESDQTFNYGDFKDNVESCINGVLEGGTLNKVDMVCELVYSMLSDLKIICHCLLDMAFQVFFPIFEREMRYLICYNLKRGEVLIFDSRENVEMNLDIYSRTTNVLVSIL